MFVALICDYYTVVGMAITERANVASINKTMLAVARKQNLTDSLLSPL